MLVLASVGFWRCAVGTSSMYHLFYLNDICIFSETIDQMLDKVALVFERLKSFNLKIKPKKMFFFQKSVTFLVHIQSAKGISPNPKKVDKVKTWLTPSNPK